MGGVVEVERGRGGSVALGAKATFMPTGVYLAWILTHDICARVPHDYALRPGEARGDGDLRGVQLPPRRGPAGSGLGLWLGLGLGLGRRRQGRGWLGGGRLGEDGWATPRR